MNLCKFYKYDLMLVDFLNAKVEKILGETAVTYQIMAWISTISTLILGVMVVLLWSLNRGNSRASLHWQSQFTQVQNILTDIRISHGSQEHFIKIFVDQKQVDSVLSTLALSLWRLCQETIVLKREDFKSLEESVRAMRAQAESWGVRISSVTAEFNQTLRVAETHGFKTRPSWRNYLPEEEFKTPAA